MKLNRNQLAERIAIERAEYEIQYESYGPEAWQAIHVFAKEAAFRIARNTPVAGITVNRGDYGVSFYARIDWKKLGAAVERQVPRWKETIRRMDAEKEQS